MFGFMKVCVLHCLGDQVDVSHIIITVDYEIKYIKTKDVFISYLSACLQTIHMSSYLLQYICIIHDTVITVLHYIGSSVREGASCLWVYEMLTM